MKKTLHIFSRISATAAAALWAYTRVVEHRSLTSWIAEHVLPVRSMHSIFTAHNQTQLARYVHQAHCTNQQPVHNPTLLAGTHVDEYTLRELASHAGICQSSHADSTSVLTRHGDTQIFVWNKQNIPKQKILLYLHGGGYIHQPSVAHFAAIARIARLAHAAVVFPIYPKLPDHTFQDTYEVLDILYRSLLARPHGPITYMGDSAGGGLSLGFALYCADHALAQPDRIIALSPWVDVATDNPDIAHYQRHDPMLRGWATGQVGRLWAEHSSNLTNPYVSPLFASPSQLKQLAPITLFVGTHEILYPDIMKFHDLLLRANIHHQLVVQPYMNHVYPLYPIAEALHAQRHIAQLIQQ